MGFRGEALSSLCNIATLVIQTKQREMETGWTIAFDHMGNVTSKEKMAKKVRIGVIPFRTVHQSS
jgi:DNA mismatch repair ATPase MutL